MFNFSWLFRCFSVRTRTLCPLRSPLLAHTRYPALLPMKVRDTKVYFPWWHINFTTSSLAMNVISLPSSHESTNVSECSHIALISKITSHVGTWYFRLFPLEYITSCTSSHVGTNIQGCLKPKPAVKSKTNSS